MRECKNDTVGHIKVHPGCHFISQRNWWWIPSLVSFLFKECDTSPEPTKGGFKSCLCLANETPSLLTHASKTTNQPPIYHKIIFCQADLPLRESRNWISGRILFSTANPWQNRSEQDRRLGKSHLPGSRRCRWGCRWFSGCGRCWGSDAGSIRHPFCSPHVSAPLNSHIYYHFHMFKSIPPPFRGVLKPPCGWQFLEEDRSFPKARLNLK